MSFRGGGDAGGRAPNKAGPEYIRRIPKFLQKYEHLIEKREGQKVVHSSTGQGSQGGATPAAPVEDEDDTFEDQIQGATIVYDERDPTTLPSHSAGDKDAKKTWSQLKEQGNAAFAKEDHKEAVRLFSEAIGLDPKNSVLYSNRSAAHAAAKNFTAALADARKALQFQPGWGKAYSRIGAGLFGLQRYEEAIEAYGKAVQAEPKNKTYQEALEQAKKKQKEVEEREAESGKHLFRKRKQPATGTPQVQQQGDQRISEKSEGRKKQQGGMLSFADN